MTIANQKQQENAFEIARQAGALYDKFEGFVADLIKIERKSKLKRNIAGL
jgi:DNA recombination protein RmuC